MTGPGFTAEASLSSWVDRRHTGRTDVTAAESSREVVPANIECDIYITCVDGIKYLVRDCPDGSGGETRIGVCPTPWWKRPEHWRIRHPWFPF
jgi:hypothetical protein